MKTTKRHSLVKAFALASSALLFAIVPHISAAMQLRIEGEGIIDYNDFYDHISDQQPYSFELTYDSDTPLVFDEGDVRYHYADAITSFSFKTGEFEWTMHPPVRDIWMSSMNVMNDIVDFSGNTFDLLAFYVWTTGPRLGPYGVYDEHYAPLNFSWGLRYPADHFDSTDLPDDLKEADLLGGETTMTFAARFNTPFFSGPVQSVSVSVIPEPGEWLFMSAGIASLAVMLRRKAKRHPR